MVEISVVVPTHKRVKLLTQHLLLFQNQSIAPESFEVIVVADGCTDGTAAAVRSLKLSYPLTLLETPGLGAAGARNRGAALAKAGVLLFLDDDMEPHRDLLLAHMQCHRVTPGGVVLGYYPMPLPDASDSVFTKHARLWWAEKSAARSRPDYRFSFYDLCTGNVSIASEAFHKAGGFDETMGKLGAGEDYELGYRLIRQRVPFQFAFNAETVHHSKVSWEDNLRRAREDGYGQAITARKHPELFREFNLWRLSRLSDSVLLRPIWVTLWRFPVLTEPPMAVARLLAASLLWLNAQTLFWRLQMMLRAHAYWKGARAAFGPLSNWERLARDAPHEPANCCEVDLELTRDLRNLDEFLREHWPVDGVRVFASGQLLGQIRPWAPGEALKAHHLRGLLVAQFSPALLGEMIKGSCGCHALRMPLAISGVRGREVGA